MAEPRGFATMTTPAKPGFYWLKRWNGWTVVEVWTYGDTDSLKVDYLGGHHAVAIEKEDGEWGEEILKPEEPGHA